MSHPGPPEVLSVTLEINLFLPRCNASLPKDRAAMHASLNWDPCNATTVYACSSIVDPMNRGVRILRAILSMAALAKAGFCACAQVEFAHLTRPSEDQTDLSFGRECGCRCCIGCGCGNTASTRSPMGMSDSSNLTYCNSGISSKAEPMRNIEIHDNGRQTTTTLPVRPILGMLVAVGSPRIVVSAYPRPAHRGQQNAKGCYR